MHAVSAGERRRLLLARALISPARMVLLDEPTEHLDADDAAPILRALLDPGGGLFGADRTVVVATHQIAGTDGRLAITPCPKPIADAPGQSMTSPNGRRGVLSVQVHRWFDEALNGIHSPGLS
jgi:ABC-type antimicrobial peptide transport system ATPase subunit